MTVIFRDNLKIQYTQSSMYTDPSRVTQMHICPSVDTFHSSSSSSPSLGTDQSCLFQAPFDDSRCSVFCERSVTRIDPSGATATPRDFSICRTV
ncbi:hypothetical protein PoB_002861400 [Plakobranchus ocellatus]|uniref:Uncharacterized protein n=1 Tax=Plakobranchus ocellatus TaxID=259542 RepID=A0AAV4A6D0_9GAST|nr:hypothetical protein PoB_002861400 [Plakobranchus ocellatus]